MIPGAGGARKLRWAAKGKGKRGGARIIYLYVVIGACVYLLRYYSKNVKTNLTAAEKKELRQIAGHLIRSAIECPEKWRRRRRPLERT